jgi:RNA polymerase sigma factor (sigma-70 family)
MPADVSDPPPRPMSSDAELIAGSRIDPERFAPIFDRHANAVHGFLARRGGREIADELLTEVFTVAFGLRRRYDRSHQNARPWLYGIAHNVLRTRLRGESRRHGLLRRLSPEPDQHPWDDVDHRLDAESPGRVAALALAQLPTGEREVIQLVAWEGLALTEVAAVLRIPPGTARSRLHRARAALQSALADPVSTHTLLSLHSPTSSHTQASPHTPVSPQTAVSPHPPLSPRNSVPGALS